jgi:N-acetylneuraminate synthase
MPWQWQPKLKKAADELGIDLFSSPFDETAVDFLEQIGVPAYKVASFELVDIPLIEYIAAKKKPMILSTGMATLSEIEEAVEAARNAGASQVALLKCNSTYPALPEDMELNAIPYLAERFGLAVGLSDHTPGIGVAAAAAAVGACIIEKHFTLSRDVPTPDSAFSVEPAEFKEMVRVVRSAKRIRCEIKCEIGINDRQSESRRSRRSLFAVADIKKGEAFTRENIRSIRPAYGLHTRYLRDILGRKAASDIKCGTPLDWGLVQ